MIEMYALC